MAPVRTETHTPDARLLVLGGGSLATATCDALATQPGFFDVLVATRRPSSGGRLCYGASARAALAGSPTRFRPTTLDLDDTVALETVLSRFRPDGVYLAASRQSPWESQDRPSAWTDLIAAAGFGLTLPLHADLAATVARAVARVAPSAWLVNACFPDAVNPLLAGLELPIACGIGNVQIIAASIQSHLGRPDQRELTVIAGHAQLHAPTDDGDEAQVWLSGQRLDGVRTMLRAQRTTPRQELNRVTGFAAAQVLAALALGTVLDTHLPGPGGLPGGYPVQCADHRIALRLPPHLNEASAIALNQRFSALDGVTVDHRNVQLHVADEVNLGEFRKSLASPFPVRKVGDIAQIIRRLRGLLRTESPAPQHQ